jgi:hypothetical protein
MRTPAARPAPGSPVMSAASSATSVRSVPLYTWGMGKGYADGPAGEELLAAQERGDHLEKPEAPPPRRFVWGSTADDPAPHMLGEVGDVDPDELFDSGRAWGLYVAVEERSD